MASRVRRVRSVIPCSLAANLFVDRKTPPVTGCTIDRRKRCGRQPTIHDNHPEQGVLGENGRVVARPVRRHAGRVPPLDQVDGHYLT